MSLGFASQEAGLARDTIGDQINSKEIILGLERDGDLLFLLVSSFLGMLGDVC